MTLNPWRVVASNTVWLAADRMTRMLLGVIVGAWVARHLGPDRFGSLAYVVAFLAIFQSATSLGLDMVLARELARPSGDASATLGTSLRLRLGASLVGWLAACGAMVLSRPGDAEALLLTALMAVGLLFQPADLLDLWFQSQNQNWRAVLPRILSFMLVSGLRVGLILNDAPLWTFAAAYLVESALALFFLGVSYFSFPTTARWHWQRERARALMGDAWPLLFSGLSTVIYMRIDQLLLRTLSGERELGLYSAMLPFSQAWHFIATTICASATPLLVNLHDQEPAAFMRRVADLFTLMFWSSLLVCIAMLFAARPLVSWLLGNEYQGSAQVLALHVFSNIPVFLGVAQARYLSIVGNTRAILIQALCGMAASIILNLLLIPRYGAMGAAASGVGAYFISAVLCNAVLEPKIFIMQMMSWKRNHAEGH